MTPACPDYAFDAAGRPRPGPGAHFWAGTTTTVGPLSPTIALIHFR